VRERLHRPVPKSDLQSLAIELVRREETRFDSEFCARNKATALKEVESVFDLPRAEEQPLRFYERHDIVSAEQLHDQICRDIQRSSAEFLPTQLGEPEVEPNELKIVVSGTVGFHHRLPESCGSVAKRFIIIRPSQDSRQLKITEVREWSSDFTRCVPDRAGR
jgi:hypothetical protein